MRKFAAAGAAGILAAALAAEAGAEEATIFDLAPTAAPAPLEITVSAAAPAAAALSEGAAQSAEGSTAATPAAAGTTVVSESSVAADTAVGSGTAPASGTSVASETTAVAAAAESAAPTADAGTTSAGVSGAAAAAPADTFAAALDTPRHSDDGNTLICTESLKGGVDAALLRAFQSAVSELAPGVQIDSSLRTAEQALSGVRIHSRQLEVSIDRIRLEETLKSGGHNVWSGLDEPVLMWLADVDQNSMVSGTADTQSFVGQLAAAALRNHYSMIFPVMDLDDVQAVSVQTVLSHSDELIAKASVRYDAKFFVAGAVQQDSAASAVFKWNLYDSKGHRLGGGESRGIMEQSAAEAAGGIARVLMENTNPSGSSTAAEEVQQQLVGDSSLQRGPGKGFVRILVTGTDNIQDYGAIISDLVTFGYGADSRLVGYTAEGAVFEVPNSSSPAILDGTLAHSSEFTKIGDWIYRFNRSKGRSRAPRSGMGPASARIPQTLSSGTQAAAAEVVIKDAIPLQPAAF